MSELSDELGKAILRAFLKAYNAERDASFSLDHLLAKSNDASCDYHFVDPGDGELKVQVTTPHGDADFRKAIARDHAFLEKLDMAIKGFRVGGVCITLSGTPLPYNKKQQDALVSQTRQVIISERPVVHHRTTVLERLDLCARSKLLGRYFSSVEIVASGDAAAPPWLILCPHEASGMPDPVTQVEQSYVRKSDKYRSSAHDLILLIYSGTIPHDTDQVIRMRSVLKPHLRHFRDVWAFCPVDSTDWRVDCIKE
jgi:hypothetical protein